LETIHYCEEIERYLCRKNDGHLIRVVGPSFELVSRWAADGVPIKIAFRGIDRYFERYYAKGSRRRPVKIDFCEADVRDVFDEWRRALGLPTTGASSPPPSADPSPGAERHSLPAHLERAVMRLSSARASGTISDALDPLIDRVAAALDEIRSHAGGIRGEARQRMLARLAALDRELGDAALADAGATLVEECRRDAAEDLRPFRDTMAREAFERAQRAAIDRLVRDRLGLPVLSYL
jgi:hypothetical protein